MMRWRRRKWSRYTSFMVECAAENEHENDVGVGKWVVQCINLFYHAEPERRKIQALSF